MIKSNISASERLTFESYNYRHGLSNNTINKIFLDSYDFLWICTDGGLNKYDGYNFKTYNPLVNNKPVDHEIECIDIVEDKYGRLWVATSEGLFVYNRELDNFSFCFFKDDSKNGESFSGNVNCLLYDKTNNLWMGTYYGIFKFKIDCKDINKEVLDNHTYYTHNPDNKHSISNNIIFSIVEDLNQQIWFSGYSKALNVYNPEGDNFNRVLIDNQTFKKTGNLEKRIVIDENGDFWIYSYNEGILFWNKKKNRFKKIEFKNKDGKLIKSKIVKSVIIDDQNRLWIGTDGNGIIIYDKTNNKTDHLKEGNNLSNLNSNAIYSLYQDRFGTIWIGTYLLGINKLAKNKSDFGHISSKKYIDNGLNHNIVTSFCEDYTGKIWISTDGGGLNIMDPKTFNFSHFQYNPDTPNGLSTNVTTSLFEDNDHNIWIGTYKGGLNCYNPQTKKFTHYWNAPNDSSSISRDSPWGFEQDKLNNLWIATVNGGINLMKYGSDSFIRYDQFETNASSGNCLSSNAINYLFIDSKENLWICTIYGLDKVDLKKVDFSAEKPKLEFEHIINHNTERFSKSGQISYITEDHNGNMWIGSKASGIFKLETETGLFTRYTKKDGLPHNMINAIIEVEDRYLWISTNNGLSKFDMETKVFKNYGVSDGIQSSVFYKASCLKTKDGMLLFGGINGFNAFYPENISPNMIVPRVAITNFKLFNKKIPIGKKIGKRIILPKSITELDKIVLEHSDNFITFEFTTLNYTSPEKNQYSYLMEGFDNEWRFVNSSNRSATYTNLNPGNYIFRVKASNNENLWNEEGVSISIIIYPPWWQTWWFILSMVLLLIGILIIIYRLRVMALKKQKKILENTVNQRTQQLQNANIELKEINATKNKFFSIIAHDIMSPFNTIMGFSELLSQNFSTWTEQKKMDTIEIIFNSSKKLFELLESLLQWSKSERGILNINKNKIDLEKMIQSSISFLKFSADAKNLEITNNTINCKIEILSDPHFIQTILRNLISNAIKFTPINGKINIEVKTNSQFAIVSIIDNGIGMSNEDIKKLFRKDIYHSTHGTNDEKGNGLGLILVNEFVIIQGGKLYIESDLGVGSTFTFTIPLWIK